MTYALDIHTHRSTDARAATLHELLDAELAYSPRFHGSYSTHLAMALAALYQLGAPADVLWSTFVAHERNERGWLEPRDDTDVLAERIEEVARAGIQATVRARIPGVLAGPATALFHPMIRLGYALDVAHEGQVAAALLDWERRLDVRAGGPHVQTQDTGTLDAVSSFAIRAHTTAEDFTTLHLVTGARALRTVAAVLDPGTAGALASHTFEAMTAIYADLEAPALLDEERLDEIRRGALPGREQIAERAIADPDPHVIKLANVALVEEARTGDALYRHAAARVTGLA